VPVTRDARHLGSRFQDLFIFACNEYLPGASVHLLTCLIYCVNPPGGCGGLQSCTCHAAPTQRSVKGIFLDQERGFFRGFVGIYDVNCNELYKVRNSSYWLLVSKFLFYFVCTLNSSFLIHPGNPNMIGGMLFLFFYFLLRLRKFSPKLISDNEFIVCFAFSSCQSQEYRKKTY
jgi:hypothetical protein